MIEMCCCEFVQEKKEEELEVGVGGLGSGMFFWFFFSGTRRQTGFALLSWALRGV